MIRGIQSSAAGMIAQMQGQDVAANNLANANTAGYKRDIPSFGATLSGALGAARTAVTDVRHGVDTAQGALQQTDNNLNLALDGDGYFSVQTADGTAYTRDGAFTRSADGYLVTQSGDKVLGRRGPIELSGGEVSVDEKGAVTQRGALVDTLQVVRFTGPEALQKAGGNLWTSASAPEEATGTRIRQGYIEQSNVSTINEMVTMITGLRTYEASQKAIQAQDETLDKLVNEVGRV